MAFEIWFLDEARIGQIGRTCRRWFEKGIRPRGRRDLRHEAVYLFGAVCPDRDHGVALALPEVSTAAMQAMLDELATAVAPGTHAVVILDRAGWHTAKELSIPTNLTPVFLPPYSPELNAIERVWLYLRERFLSHRLEGGQIDRTIVAGLGLDLFRLFGAVVGATPKTVELRCALADLKIGDGYRPNRSAPGRHHHRRPGWPGHDQPEKRGDRHLAHRPAQETPLLTDLTGISIGGKLGAPELNINPLAVAARSVTAATLGALLKPFTSLAGAVDEEAPSACASLLRRAVSAEGG